MSDCFINANVATLTDRLYGRVVYAAYFRRHFPTNTILLGIHHKTLYFQLPISSKVLKVFIPAGVL